jgi:thiol-disulfide isomerase/thioredoxin
MRRRELLAGLAGLSALGGAGFLYRSGAIGGDGESGVDPVSLPTVEAPGSPGADVTVPARGRVSLVTFFATWCHVCAAEMEPLGAVAVDLDESVQLVSVTNEPVGHSVSRPEIREWWREHDGDWPVALDPDLALTDALDVGGVPTLLVLDADNRVTWRHQGRASAETIRSKVARARQPTGDGDRRLADARRGDRA